MSGGHCATAHDAPAARDRLDPRYGAVQVLERVLRHGRSLTRALEQARALRDPRDEGLRRELCYGVARYGPRLEAAVELLLERPLRRRDADVQAALLIGLYQLLYTRAPAHAAVATSVDAAGRLGKPWAKGLVNGVLRRFLRDRQRVLQRLERSEAARLSHPRWMIELIRETWDENWPAILRANNEHPPMTLRVNQRRSSRAQYHERLQRAGLPASPCPTAPSALTLHRPCRVTALPGFDAGEVSVQDAAAQLAAGVLDPPCGASVLDACAAPGGKAAHLLERVDDLRLVAVDVDAERCERIHRTLERLALSAQVLVADVREPDTWWDGQPFERILVDAPCSASGVIRRHPDAKWLRRGDDLEALAGTQRALLDAVWPLLARGGRLLYATCSILPQENDRVIEAFLAGHRGARVLGVDATWGRPTAHGRQILPGEEGMDGFYYAQLAKA